MQRTLKIVGIVLIVFAFVILSAFIIIPAVIPSYDTIPPLKALMQTLFCKQGETLKEDRETYNDPRGTVTSISLACVNKEGQARDVSGSPIGIGFVGYIVPFLAGMFAYGVSSSMKKREQAAAYSRNFSGRSNSYVLSQKNQYGQAQALNSTEPYFHNTSDDNSGHDKNMAATENRISRLKELKEAHDAGLITDEEYQAKHQEILKEM